MGYTTDFTGQFDLDRKLSPEHEEYLHAFSASRRMGRDADKTVQRDDPVRERAKLGGGPGGGYFVTASGYSGQDRGADVLDRYSPPAGQPGLWCQWEPSEDGLAIVWNDGEKFYSYTEWLEYLIAHFLKPWGYTLNGAVEWAGEERDDRGRILVEDNELRVQRGTILYEDQ